VHGRYISRVALACTSFLENVRQTDSLIGVAASCFSERMKPKRPVATKRRLTAVLATLLLMQMLIPARLMAQSAPAGSMDLSSKDRTVVAGQSPNFQATDIKVGRQTRTINAGDMLTPAEYAALQQVLTTGTQTLTVGRDGNAVHGTLNLTPDLSSVIGDLVIPKRVTVINDFGLGSSLDIGGNLNNSGRFYAVSSNASVTNAVINANNIFNNTGAVLS